MARSMRWMFFRVSSANVSIISREASASSALNAVSAEKSNVSVSLFAMAASTTSTISCWRNGLCRHPAKPSPRSESTSMSLRAVTAITGIDAASSHPRERRLRSRSKPFMAGIWMSVSTASWWHSAILTNSSCGCRHTVMLAPRLRSMASVSCSCRLSSSMSSRLHGWLNRAFAAGRSLADVVSASALGIGSSTPNRLPSPGLLLTLIVPPSRATSFCVIDSPSPKPSCPCALFRRVNSWNIRFCSSSVIPHPVSATLMLSRPLSSFADIDTEPSLVNFIAFDIRFSTICRMRKGSPEK